MATRVPIRADLLGLGLAVLLLWSGLTTLDADRVRRETDLDVANAQRPAYPSEVCLVTGVRLVPRNTVEVIVEGRLVRVAGGAAAREVLAQPAGWVRRLDSVLREREGARYPLEVCPVDGRPLSEGALDAVIAARLVRVCDEECRLAAHAELDAVTRTIDEAHRRVQRERYPLDTCIVSGADLGADAVEVMYGTTLLRLADAGARSAFLIAPQRYLAELRRLRSD